MICANWYLFGVIIGLIIGIVLGCLCGKKRKKRNP